MSITGEETSGYTVQCSANRGRQYEVAFSSSDEIQSVRVKVYRCDGVHWRLLWNTTYPDMTTGVACAIRSAQAKRKEEIQSDIPDHDRAAVARWPE